MNNRPSHNLDGLDIDMARRIDEVCRRFEAERRQERHHSMIPGRGPREKPTLSPGRAGSPGTRVATNRWDRRVGESSSAAECLTVASAEPLTHLIPGKGARYMMKPPWRLATTPPDKGPSQAELSRNAGNEL